MADILKPGSRGEPVKALQTELVQLGFSLTPDGSFGPATGDAVAELQALFGYDVDKSVGPATQGLITQQAKLGFDVRKPELVKQAIDASGNKTALKHVLKPGSEGADVRFLQRRLNVLGFAIEVDGKFGPATDKAVRALQTAFKYDVDGAVGEATHKLINQQIGFGWNSSKAPVA
ncbi:MAG TPA: peptidoglycan-binding protein [Polyangiales bacterium]|nr:peptidoglycan-binding protein [Polyangiales bacterium]